MSIFSRRFRVIVASLVLIFVAFTAFVVGGNATTDLGNADLSLFADTSEEQVERGRYLAIVGNCATCHTAPGGAFMAGGLPFKTPFGSLFSTNITPDDETGIGTWTGLEFLKSMRQGTRPNGEHLYPAFPYTAFTRVSDADVAALFAYLRSVPAIHAPPPANELAFPFNIRAFLAVWKALYFEEGEFVADAGQPAAWNRGAYLVEALAHCSACHAPRNFLGAEQAERGMVGGVYNDKVPSGAYRPWSAPNLTGSESGLGIWPHADVAAYLKTGRNAFVETFGPMNEVTMNSTRHLATEDIDAMATYLKSLPAMEAEAGPEARQDVLGMGRTLYNLHCGTCHLPTGLGDPEIAPRLSAGSLVVRAANPASLINVILDGPQAPEPPLPPKWRNPMDSFRYVLDDEEVAALATYVRNSWGNHGSQVSPAQVATQR